MGTNAKKKEANWKYEGRERQDINSLKKKREKYVVS
jgi:hypothetical protein